ncbi:phosphatidylinositol 4-kinase gamma 6-like [Cynara cardunculus var. scolymus]|uniref:1-phosphatidylinositol 4-kinase n=1 Tax=Cynara cardunculus var. scolymus TaxID=59895 RepID=A0A103YH23_CYNCS|nr:phosphatidylinositol 4-kinase gamma 6-like [Cynara cardunculus var. scolymus]XP_024960091.1 phosphatidylinositol 4-kinase gamma 6-like [Cynara cardunculus var. scolymus]XP_024960099.1 phosphatidylinositol 4-kinase gamma 6-like [Cynara cardunculus var. scolymus]XP_024960107.1 phosphatidylinositol 4-kinase gamma 6-like [Cynara cardunculus var. scolymus]XP_024960115.1 phosphatidylinositol 4-kinase gamma 6-like [Cynara cardunculus var. scolymus]XP_024960122.1 phosphatidylinositol 4-kinase gamma
MAAAPFKIPFRKDNHGERMEAKFPGKRRIFVQTETGCALGIELDGNDDAHTVKRRLQTTFNVPTEEWLLVLGDQVLNNDLSTVRNGSPVLLTRNFLHRSSSTSCLSPVSKDTEYSDHSESVEILVPSMQFSRTKQLVHDIAKAIESGIAPVPISSGLGGAYYFRNCDGDNVAIVKPTDEEPFAPNNPKGFVGKVLGQPGLKPSVRVGETGFREVAAFLLDHDQSAKVPPTTLVKIRHSIFNINDEVSESMLQNMMHVCKIASLQQYIRHDFDASDHGTISFPVSAVHRIGILDIRILNTDRHAGNILVKKLDSLGSFGQVELVPIDHGLCLPESLEDPYFEWIHWPQASVPFSYDELEYISNLDPVYDSELLRMELPMIREACLRVLVLCTIFLKEAASFGLCLTEIGEMMTREFHGHEEEPSELESICIQARKLLEESESWSPAIRTINKEVFQFDIEYEEDFGNGGNMLSDSVESFETEEEDYLKLNERGGDKMQVQAVSKLSTSMKACSIEGQNWRNPMLTVDVSYTASSSSGNRSMNGQLPRSMSFVTFSDMSQEEWTVFLGHFEGLLHSAFTDSKSRNLGLRQRQRLGTSCQF